MKKNTLIIAVIVVLIIIAVIVAICIFGSKKTDNTTNQGEKSVETNTQNQAVNKEEIVKTNVENYLKSNYEGIVEEVSFTEVKVYTDEEISSNEALKEYNLTSNDIVFSIKYDMKIKEGSTDMMQFTAGSGTIDGNYVKEKSNVGMLRYGGSDDYSVVNFGTGF